MLALLLLVLIPLVMWLCQSVLLRCAGLPLRLRISAADLPRPLKRVNRAVTYLAFTAVLLGYPVLRGQTPLAYYGAFLPRGYRAFEALYGAAAAILYLTLLYLAWMLTDNIRFRVRHSPARLIQRLAGVPPTAVLVAVVEELLFRAILLAGLMESLPARVALPIGVVAFAAAHYVRSVKRRWTFLGHLALGSLFCTAFFRSGALWLPIGLHAGGVLVLMAVRPFVRYTGPAWLVGASIFPYAGAVGIMALILLTINMWFLRLSYGGGT